MHANPVNGIDAERLYAEIDALYARLAAAPRDEFDCNRGMRFAMTMLNYAPEALENVPRASLARFVGRGNPHRIGNVLAGETVLDAGCGAGSDLIIAAHATGPAGRVIGVDICGPLLDCAWTSACIAGVDGWTTLLAADYTDLPLDSGSVDVVMLNGSLNIALDKRRVLAECFRVLKPGGRLYLAEAVINEDIGFRWRDDIRLWAHGVAGALNETELRALVSAAGFTRLQLTERFDCFNGSRIALSMPVAGAINLFARKPMTAS